MEKGKERKRGKERKKIILKSRFPGINGERKKERKKERKERKNTHTRLVIK